MTIYYKATRPDGTDFYTGTVDYGAALTSGRPVVHPNPHSWAPQGYLSVSVEPAETLIGGKWPCRLFRVEPDGDACKVDDLQHKRAVFALTVVEELEAWRALGPNGEAVAQFIARIPGTAWGVPYGATARDATWRAARSAARDAARSAARDAAYGAASYAACGAVSDAAWDAVSDAAWDAVDALVVRDLITQEQFSTLTAPWKTLTGEEL